MAYPIDFIRDQQRAELARQTRGILPATSAQQGMVVSDARVNQALANMFATQQKMAMAEDARLQQRAVMLQRQREQQAALEARAREAQLARDARAMEGERMRAAQRERLDKQLQFQRSMQRRRLGSGRGSARLDRYFNHLNKLSQRQELSPGAHDRNVKLAEATAKRIKSLDPKSAQFADDIVSAMRGHRFGRPYGRETDPRQAQLRVLLEQRRGLVRERGDAQDSLDDARVSKIGGEIALLDQRLNALTGMSSGVSAQPPQAAPPQAAPPQAAPPQRLQPGQSKPVPVGVRNSFPANVEFEVPGLVGVFIHDGQTLRRER
mgnify:FL=1|tara:strand:- start:916 stop:1878 length:963 start_codon:yes stop_codon:yes gene_type:complete